MSHAVIVGGGIAGLLSARILVKSFDRVVLIERSGRVGGLLGSIQDDSGAFFDHGTHILQDTGDRDLDAILFGGLDSNEWRRFDRIHTGCFFRGRMYRESGFVNCGELPEPILRQGRIELLATIPFSPGDCANLEEFLIRKFGATFAKHVLFPVVRKQFGVHPCELDADNPFVPRRVVCFAPQESRELKQNPFFDQKVAFASFREGPADADHYYPRRGGIGLWVEEFARSLSDLGVEILVSSSIEALETSDQRVTGIALCGGRKLDCDLLLWSVPSRFLLDSAGVEYPSPPFHPRPIGLFHYVFDRPFRDSNHFVTCHDPKLRTYRVTLYPQLRCVRQQPPYNCTVEVIGSVGEPFQELEPRVREELCEMGIVSGEARVVSAAQQVVPVGFPTLTPDYVTSLEQQEELVRTHLRNAILVGRAKRLPFFMKDVLRETYEVLSEEASSPLLSVAERFPGSTRRVRTGVSP